MTAMSTSDVATFIEPGTSGGHRFVVGGLSILERVIRACGARGVRRVEVPCAPIDVARGGVAHGVDVVWLAPDALPDAGQPVVRGDEVAGVRVVDDASRRRAEWAVLRGLPKSHQGATDALINWRASLRITRALARTPLRPNHVTVAATVLGLIAWALALTDTALGLAGAGLLLQLHSILDSCDGELARLRYQFSRLGEWLDNVTDEIVDDGFAVCAGVVAGGPWLWLGVLGGARALAVTVQGVDTYRRTGSGNPYAFRYWFERVDATPAEVWDRASALYWLRALGRRDTYVFLWMLLCLAGQPAAIAAYAGALGGLTLALTAIHLAVQAGRRR
jgi:phosphatidylglycerophosphate synthase